MGKNNWIYNEQSTNRHLKRHADQIIEIIEAGTFYKNAEALISEPETTVECNSPTQIVTNLPKKIINFHKSELNDKLISRLYIKHYIKCK